MAISAWYQFDTGVNEPLSPTPTLMLRPPWFSIDRISTSTVPAPAEVDQVRLHDNEHGPITHHPDRIAWVLGGQLP